MKTPREARVATGSGPTVVVAEDEWLIARYICEILSRAGYRVAPVVRSATALLAAVEEARPSVVLVDISLEARDAGLAVVEEHEIGARAAVVFVSAHTDPATMKRAKRARCRGFVVKPFTPNELLTALDAAIAGSGRDG